MIELFDGIHVWAKSVLRIVPEKDGTLNVYLNFANKSHTRKFDSVEEAQKVAREICERVNKK